MRGAFSLGGAQAAGGGVAGPKTKSTLSTDLYTPQIGLWVRREPPNCTTMGVNSNSRPLVCTDAPCGP